MGRLGNQEEAQREEIEGDLAILGNARVYLRLIDERLRLAAGKPEIVSPAVENLHAADILMLRLQDRIKTRYSKGTNA